MYVPNPVEYFFCPDPEDFRIFPFPPSRHALFAAVVSVIIINIQPTTTTFTNTGCECTHSLVLLTDGWTGTHRVKPKTNRMRFCCSCCFRERPSRYCMWCRRRLSHCLPVWPSQISDGLFSLSFTSRLDARPTDREKQGRVTHKNTHLWKKETVWQQKGKHYPSLSLVLSGWWTFFLDKTLYQMRRLVRELEETEVPEKGSRKLGKVKLWRSEWKKTEIKYKKYYICQDRSLQTTVVLSRHSRLLRYRVYIIPGVLKRCNPNVRGECTVEGRRKTNVK